MPDPDAAPILLMTRPLDAARRFVADLEMVVDTLYAPLLQIELLPSPLVEPDCAAIILTSENGAQAAARIKGLPKLAYCVGDRTAQAAQLAGFVAISAQGDAAALIAVILAHHQSGPLLHIRGEHTRGDVAQRLNSAGIPTQQLIAYRQQELTLSVSALNALMGKRPVIMPLFSPRTVTILIEQGPYLAPLHIVPISPAVAKEACKLRSVSVTQADFPDATAMAQAVRACVLRVTTG